MSMKTVYMCDHCGAECDGDQYASIGRWDEPKTITFGKTIHGCTKEHLGLALAKAFGIGVDGRCAGIITAKDLEISSRDKLIEEARQAHAMLESQIQHLNRSLDEQSKLIGTDRAESTRAILENGRLQSKMRYLEQQLAAANAPSITDTTKPTKPAQAIDNCDAYIEARMDYRRVAGGTFAEMHTFWDDNVDDFRHGERLVGANGDIVESMDQ